VRRYPDVVDNLLFSQWAKARAQAHYLGETWHLTPDEYIALWRENNRYLNKGRGNENFCLVRNKYDLPWQLDNVKVVTRLEHYQICSRDKTGKFALRKQRKEKARV
jgi:hypothetical protein